MYKKLLFGLVAFGLLSVLFAACGIVDTSQQASGPAVHMGGTTFIQSTIKISKGSSLTIINDAPSTHIIVNGTWKGTTAKPGAESGAPTINHTFAGQGDSFTIGPFNTAGSFNYYCTIHLGMNLTVTVS